MADDELKLTLRFAKQGEEALKTSADDVGKLAKASKELAGEQRKAADPVTKFAKETKGLATEEKRRFREWKGLTKDQLADIEKRARYERKERAEKERAEAKLLKERQRDESKAAKLRDAAAKKEHDATSKATVDNETYGLSWLMLADRAYQWVRAHADAAIAAEAFETHLTKQLELYTKSAPAAAKLFSELEGLGARTGSGDEMGRWALKLQEAKLEGEDLKKTLSAMADLKAMGFNPDAFEQAAKGIREMELAGRKVMTGTQLVEMFKATGLDQERLEKSLGLEGSRYEINRQLALMKVNTKDGMMALRRAVQDATGKPLGAFAAGSEDTVQNKMGMVSKYFDALMAKTDFSPITNSLERLLSNFQDPEVVEMFGEALDDVAYAASFAVDAFGGLALGTAWLIKTIGRTPEYLGDAWDWVVEKIRDVVDGISEFFHDLPSKFVEFGTDVVSGFLKGILGGAGALYGGVKDMIRGLIGGVREELDSHSPSKELEYIGHHEFDAGLEKGINAGAPKVTQAAADMTSDAVGGASGAAAGGASGGAGAIGGASSKATSIVINWNAPSPDSGPSQATEMAFREMFARVAHELAVAA